MDKLIPQPQLIWRIDGERALPAGGTATLLATAFGRTEEKAWEFFAAVINGKGRTGKWERSELKFTCVSDLQPAPPT